MVQMLVFIFVLIAILHWLGYKLEFNTYTSIKVSPWPYKYSAYLYVWSLVFGYLGIGVLILSTIVYFVSEFTVGLQTFLLG